MGYFNVSCGLSGISMSDDEVVLIPLRKPHNKYTPPFDEDGAHIIYDNGQAYYEVETLPIYGNLNSFGSIENIRRDANVDILENYYQRKIEDIAEMSSNSYRRNVEGNPKHLPQLPTAGMWVNGEVYEEVSKLENVMLDVRHMWRLRQSLLYESSNIPKDLELPEDFSKLSVFELKYLKYLHARKKREEVCPEIQEIDQELIDHALSACKPVLCGYFGCNGFINIYGRNNSNPEIIKEYVKFKHFDLMMMFCNKLYGPTINPLHNGNLVTEKFLHELSLRIVERKLSDDDTNI